jgi:type II secretory pathway pseudopilin PulG
VVSTSPRRSQGAVILGVFVLLALFGFALLGAVRWLKSVDRHDKEQELLAVGREFREAIDRYRNAPGGSGQPPRKLEDLLQDPRFPSTVRHLRRIYADPMTGKTQWGLVKAPDGGILGVFSLSIQEPMKRQGFSLADQDIEQFVRTKLEFLSTKPSGSAVFPAENASVRLNLVAGVMQVNSASPEGEPLEPDPSAYSYRDWKFVPKTRVIGTSGPRGMGGG